jgi:predicted TIM-barrel fold metal-dependent hydrolase
MRRHFYGCFIEDPIGITLREAIGVENIMWESDYPHGDSYWPHSRKHITEQLSAVPDDEARLIVETNAARVFNI